MALFTSTSFTGSTAVAPSGSLLSAIAAVDVSIILSDGSNKMVFDSVTTAMQCLTYMNGRNMYYMAANDDITIVNIQTKLLILENTYINQKMMNSFVFSYHGKSVVGVHRNLSILSGLSDCLSSVGFKSIMVFNTNADLETSRADAERPRIKVVDFFYGNASGGSKLIDTTQIVYT